MAVPNHPPRKEPVSYQALAGALKAMGFSGGEVEIKGERLDTKIGAGVAAFFAALPEGGVTLEKVADVHYLQLDVETKKQWLRQVLLPKGLVQKSEEGRYGVTPAALNASYTILPYNRSSVP